MKWASPASCRYSRPRRPTRCCRSSTGGRKSCSRSTARSEREIDCGCGRVMPEDVARPLGRRRRVEATALPSWVKPQRNKLVDQPPDGPEWLHELKFDGYRMHARLDQGAVRLLTRTGLDWTHKYPAIAAAIASLPARQAYLDGELCGVRPDGTTSFSLIQNASDT